jgi:hypothetical protein
MKLCKSETTRRVDGESFRVAKMLKKTLVFEVYAGCSGRGHVHTWASSMKGHIQLEKP